MNAYFDKLRKLQQNAYAPYSNFQVAAILVMKNGDEYVGVNVENASYGGTVCAERSAFVSAVSQAGHGGYAAIHLLGGKSESFCMPCGFCRQVMSELASSDFEIVVYNVKGESKSYSIDELLPHSFSNQDLSTSSS